MDLVLFGIQGSGKGTQAKRLAQEFGYDIFEAGGELRKMVASGSQLGQIVKSYIDVGKLVPHEIIIAVVKESIAQRDQDQKILFDGIPRDLDQMKDFDAIMAEAGREFSCIQITLDRDEAVARILSRAEKEGRADDADRDAIDRRMNLFAEKTLPVIEAYRARGIMNDVAGDGTVDDVYERLKLTAA